MRFDVFELLGPSLFRTRQKESPGADKREAIFGRRATPHTESSDYPEPQQGGTLETGLADPRNPVFRCLTRHERWATVHHLTHTTTVQ